MARGCDADVSASLLYDLQLLQSELLAGRVGSVALIGLAMALGQ